MDLNLRGVDDELARTIKATAASEGITMKDFVVGILKRDIQRGGWTAPATVEKKPAARGKKAVAVVADPLGVALELAASGVELPAVVVESKPVIIAPVHQVPERAVNHAENCRCYLCKPPK
jgi:hypothetical protein